MKLLVFVLSGFFCLLTLSFPVKAVDYSEFSCQQACNADEEVTTGNSRPATGETCNPGYMNPSSSCARTFEVRQEIKFRRNEGPCLEKTWHTKVYIDLSRTTLPFVGKKGEEDVSKYLADLIAGTSLYNLKPGEEISQDIITAGVLRHLSPDRYEDRLRRGVISLQGMGEVHDYLVTDGEETMPLSKFMDEPYPLPEMGTPEYAIWKNTKAGRLWEYIPLTTQEDTIGYILPYASLRSGLPDAKENFEILNANVTSEGIPISVPHLGRLAASLRDLQRVGIFNDNYRGIAETEPANSQAIAETLFCEERPVIAAPVTNAGVPLKAEIVSASIDACQPNPPPVIDNCEKQPLFDNKPNDPLCSDPPCDPKKTTIVAELTATDRFINDKYLECRYEQQCGPGLCFCPPNQTCCCEVLVNPECLDEVSKIVSRQVGIKTQLEYLSPIWQYLCGDPTNTYPLYWGIARYYWPGEEGPCDKWNNVYGASTVNYSCDNCEEVFPATGAFNYPKLGGIDMVISALRDEIWLPGENR